jgi:aryl-alcohol dehydrogenase-like predicted oxidoreductase
MEYRQLGRAGVKVSAFCLGTMNFGPHTTEADSRVIMDKALELGINFFDTANVYGWKKGEGVTEQIIGRWFAQGGGRREKVVLATKCYGAMGDGPNDRGLSALHIKRACEGSLKRLRTDFIDLYQMHHVERATPFEEIWEAMEQLRREGKILYVGSSNFAAWDIATANQIASKRNVLGLVSEQSKYSLASRMIELEVIPCCKAYGVGIIPWSPLEGGILGGMSKKLASGRRASANPEFRKKVQRLMPQIKRYESFCKKLGESPADVALAWMLANPAITSPIIGPRTLDQLTGSLRALKIKLKDDAMKTLDEIWPGPGGAAPNAYAW